LPRSVRSILVALVALLILVALAIVAVPALRHRIASLVPHDRLVQLNGLRFGYRVDREVRIPMPDGDHLAASVYLPRGDEKRPTVLVRLPYGRLEYGEALNTAEYFARRGYAVVVEDLRGTFDSQGEFLPYAHGASDGAATLDWIAAQPWSNGRVGSFGCSSLGETQYLLARSGRPSLRAMIPLGAGGIVGSAAGRYSYFGLYEGGVFQLASGFGWFVENGAKSPQAAPMQPFDIGAALRDLPVSALVQRHRPGPNAYDDFMRLKLSDPAWRDLGYLDDADLPDVPTFEVTTWGDQTVGDTLAFAASLPARYAAAKRTPPERHLVIAPGTHCHHEETGVTGRFGDLVVANAEKPYFEWYERWFDHWLRDRGDGLASLPPVLYYMIGEHRWLTASSWPPPQARVERWYLDGEGRANGARGDGALAWHVRRARPSTSSSMTR
jgi:putative CocE/NonD family hydrolase